MAHGKRLATNVLWNWSGMAARMGVGFLVAPFLVRSLGGEGYGLWTLVASLTGYFSLMDLGVRGSVGRNLAFYRAKGDFEGVNGIFNTSLAILLGVAALAGCATFAIIPTFFALFTVPPEAAADTQAALWIICLNLAITFPLSVFDATLWALQRFDRINAMDVPGVLLQACGTYIVVSNGYGLQALAWVTLATTLFCGIPKLWMGLSLEPNLRMGLRYVNSASAKCLFGYSVWYFLLSMSRMITPQIGPQVVGSQLGVMLVTPYSVVSRLLGYATSLMVAATGVLTPHMTTLHAEDDLKAQRKLFLTGGKYCLSLSLFFLLFFLFLGKPFLTLWMGPSLEYPYALLVVLTLGETIPMAQWVTHSMILGMNKHKPTACLSLAECLCCLLLAVLFVGPFGLLGVAIAVSAPGILCRGLIQLVYACRLVQVPFTRYFTQAALPSLAVAIGPCVVLAAWLNIRQPHSWLQLLLAATAYGVTYVLCGLTVFVGWKGMASKLASFPRRHVAGSIANAAKA